MVVAYAHEVGVTLSVFCNYIRSWVLVQIFSVNPLENEKATNKGGLVAKGHRQGKGN